MEHLLHFSTLSWLAWCTVPPVPVRLGEQEHLSLTSCWVDMYFRFTMAGVGSRPCGVYFQLRRVQVDLQCGVCVRRREAET
jgi:hypothetical protein